MYVIGLGRFSGLGGLDHLFLTDRLKIISEPHKNIGGGGSKISEPYQNMGGGGAQ